jgi:hypothetical protein
MGFKRRYIVIGMALLLLSSVWPAFAKAQASKEAEFVLMGNDIGIKSASIKHIRSIFRGKYSSWNNKQTVIIVLPSKKNTSIKDVSSYIYETSTTGMQKFWLSQVFQGRSNPPVFLDSDEEIIRYVAKNPGAIGIVYKPTSPISAGLIINIIQ